MTPFDSGPGQPEPDRGTAQETVRPGASGGDAIVLVAITVLVVAAAFLGNTVGGAAVWLGLAGVALGTRGAAWARKR